MEYFKKWVKSTKSIERDELTDDLKHIDKLSRLISMENSNSNKCDWQMERAATSTQACCLTYDTYMQRPIGNIVLYKPQNFLPIGLINFTLPATEESIY